MPVIAPERIPMPLMCADFEPGQMDVAVAGIPDAMLACRGWSNAEIARHMGVSSGTVKNRLSSVYAKLGIASRTELAAHMLR